MLQPRNSAAKRQEAVFSKIRPLLYYFRIYCIEGFPCKIMPFKVLMIELGYLECDTVRAAGVGAIRYANFLHLLITTKARCNFQKSTKKKGPIKAKYVQVPRS